MSTLLNTIIESVILLPFTENACTPIEFLYKITNGGTLFTIIMITSQMIIPFYISYYAIKKVQHLKQNQKLNDIKDELEVGVVEYASKK